MVTFWWSHVCEEPSLISTKRRLFAVGLLVNGARRFTPAGFPCGASPTGTGLSF
jgi:hypothetical protein